MPTSSAIRRRTTSSFSRHHERHELVGAGLEPDATGAAERARTAPQREKQRVPQKQGLGLGSEVLGRRRTEGCWHHFVRLQRRIEDLHIAFCT